MSASFAGESLGVGQLNQQPCGEVPILGVLCKIPNKYVKELTDLNLVWKAYAQKAVGDIVNLSGGFFPFDHEGQRRPQLHALPHAVEVADTVPGLHGHLVGGEIITSGREEVAAFEVLSASRPRHHRQYHCESLHPASVAQRAAPEKVKRGAA